MAGGSDAEEEGQRKKQDNLYTLWLEKLRGAVY